MPRQTHVSTSRSRGVSGWVAAGARASASSRRPAAFGSITASPSCAARIARTTSCGGGRLEQVAGGAGAHGGQELLVVAEARQHDHARLRPRLADLLHRPDAVEPRHLEVHQHDVRREPRRLGDRLDAVARLADDLDPLLQAEERAEPLADDLVVVDDEHADRAQPSGASSRTVVPAPAAESIASRPPSRRARSSIELSPSRRDADAARLRVEADRRRRATSSTSRPSAVAEPEHDPARARVAGSRSAAPPARSAAARGRGRRRAGGTPSSSSAISGAPSWTRRSTSTCLRSVVASPSRSSSGGRSSRIR